MSSVNISLSVAYLWEMTLSESTISYLISNYTKIAFKGAFVKLECNIPSNIYLFLPQWRKRLCLSHCYRLQDDVEWCWMCNIQFVCHANKRKSLCYFFSINVWYSPFTKLTDKVNMQIRSENPKFALATIFLHGSVWNLQATLSRWMIMRKCRNSFWLSSAHAYNDQNVNCHFRKGYRNKFCIYSSENNFYCCWKPNSIEW